MLLAPSIDSASSLLLWSNVVYIGGAVLTLGAAMHVRHEKRRVDAGKKSRVSFASEASVIAAAIVSLLGTAGAIYFGGVVSHLKDIDLATYKTQADVQIAQAQKDAATANQLAAQAYSNAGVAGKQAMQAGLVAQQSNANAIQSRIEAVQASNQGVVLQSQLQQEQAARANIEKSMAPRVITATQKQTIVAAMQPYFLQHIGAARPTVTVDVVAQENEAQQYASSLSGVLEDAGISTSRNTMLGASGTGIVFLVRSKTYKVPPLALAIAGALQKAGISCNFQEEQYVPTDTFQLAIGAKP